MRKAKDSGFGMKRGSWEKSTKGTRKQRGVKSHCLCSSRMRFELQKYRILLTASGS